VNHVAAATIVAAGYEAPLYIALPTIAAVIVVRMVVSKTRGGPAIAGKIMFRCSKGHVFTATASPLASLVAIRLGAARFQRCPVGHHWTLVRPVNDSDLTDENRPLAGQDR
jgi:hypothetical protein